MSPRGTTRTPGADPTRLPTGLDLRAISMAEGVRAGVATALPIAAAVWLAQPSLSLSALGALLTCIVDPGGPIRRRVPLLLAFVCLGACLLGGFGLIRRAGIPLTLCAALPALFATGFLRVWGAPAQALGNILAVVLLLGTDERLSVAQAAQVGGLFAAGGTWALLLTLALWRIYPYGPARRAVAETWHALSSLAGMTQKLIEDERRSRRHSAAGWDAQARAGRGAVRAAIEQARASVMATVDRRGAASGPTAQNLLRLETADQLFAALIALSDQTEHADPSTQSACITLLRRLRPLLRLTAAAIERERHRDAARFERAIEAMRRDAQASPALAHLGDVIADRLRVATKLVDPAQYLPGSGPEGDAGIPRRQRLTAPAAANWTFSSASLRHAVRVAAVTTVCLGFTLLQHGPYTHWLTITLVLVMQPFFATTWQRTLERVGGTLLGGTVAAGLSAVTSTRLYLAALLPVLGGAALAVRQVSYGVYIAVYTPVVILLVEQARPQDDQLGIALARAGYTIAGGLIAITANLLLWPAWQPEQVRRDLCTVIAAHAAYARAVLMPSDLSPGRERQRAGLASNNLEASLQRALHEPRRGQRDQLQTVLTADATLRRIAGRLTAMTFRAPSLPSPMASWVVDALQTMSEGFAAPARPSGLESEEVDRLARQVELLGATLGKRSFFEKNNQESFVSGG